MRPAAERLAPPPGVSPRSFGAERGEAERLLALPALSDLAICPMFEPFAAEAAKPPEFTQDFARRAIQALARQFRRF